jgi:hypothetical protein
MDLDALLYHYFGTAELEGIGSGALETGKERLGIDFGVEQEPSRRFALWTLMEALGIAPPPAEAFRKHPALQRAAEDYLTIAWKMDRD